ncbi:MAG: hypothetical protein LC667_08220 [Thioalkalivibrio sp.]|nr:hypothetical protein [Thioalkalivibrio sp.]
MDADHSGHDGGEHDLQDGEIGEQQLPDNHVVFRRAAFLQQKAEHDAERQSPEQG